MESQKKNVANDESRSHQLEEQLNLLKEENQKLQEKYESLQVVHQNLSKDLMTVSERAKKYEEKSKKHHQDNEILKENIFLLQKMLSENQDASDLQRIEQDKIIRGLENQIETMSVASSRVSSKGEKDTPKHFGFGQPNVEKMRQDMMELSKMNERLKLQNAELVAEIKDRENDENKFATQVNQYYRMLL